MRCQYNEVAVRAKRASEKNTINRSRRDSVQSLSSSGCMAACRSRGHKKIVVMSAIAAHISQDGHPSGLVPQSHPTQHRRSKQRS